MKLLNVMSDKLAKDSYDELIYQLKHLEDSARSVEAYGTQATVCENKPKLVQKLVEEIKNVRFLICLKILFRSMLFKKYLGRNLQCFTVQYHYNFQLSLQK